MYRTDDPIADISRHEDDQERWLRKRPLCSYCDEHIADEFAYNINGEWVCEMCMYRNFRQMVPEE